MLYSQGLLGAHRLRKKKKKKRSQIPDTYISLNVNGSPIEYVDCAKCLGVTFDTKLTWNKHINNKIKQAKLYLHQMKTSISRTWGPTPEKMLWIWNTVVRPAITYASYIWGTNLTKTQKEKLNKIQRMGLMQLGNFRYSTPTSGLDVILGQLPLDLYILETAMRTHVRLEPLEIRDWNGKGPGTRGRIGHILRMEKLMTEMAISHERCDAIPKEKSWIKKYKVEENMDGTDITQGLRLYTDGSRLDDNSGYGAVLMNDDQICDETFGSIGTQATVYQAECYAILHGLDMVERTTKEITILSDNQALVKALDSEVTTDKSIRMLKTKLNQAVELNNTKIKIKWIKAHVGYPGNEYADDLAKKGTELILYGPEPIVPLSKPVLKNEIRKIVHKMWEERWENRTDARQTAIFFPKIDLKRSSELTQLSKEAISITVRAITGHDHRSRHKGLIAGESEGKCRFCNGEPETPSHIILYCPRLLNLRAQKFLSYDAESIVQSWEAKQLAAFLTVEHIAAMEQED